MKKTLLSLLTLSSLAGKINKHKPLGNNIPISYTTLKDFDNTIIKNLKPLPITSSKNFQNKLNAMPSIPSPQEEGSDQFKPISLEKDAENSIE